MQRSDGFRGVLQNAAIQITITYMQGISIKLAVDLGNAIAAEARRRNVTQSALVRESLERSPLACPQGEGQPTWRSAW